MKTQERKGVITSQTVTNNECSVQLPQISKQPSVIENVSSARHSQYSEAHISSVLHCPRDVSKNIMIESIINFEE